MLRPTICLLSALAILGGSDSYAQTSGTAQLATVQATMVQAVVDIPTRQSVTVRALVLVPKEPKGVVLLLAGGHGGLKIAADGSFGWGANNFLVRSRQLFAEQGLVTIVVDAPSDRQKPPYLSGFRTTGEHVADLKAVIGWARQGYQLPVWLVGTSRGTETAAFVATQLASPDGPDGIVLTSTILTDNKVVAVPQMELGKIRVPVLVVHHVQDGCSHCAYRDVPGLLARLTSAPRKQLLPIQGGTSRGDPCEAFAYHGFNGVERDVVAQIAGWMLAK